MNHTDSIKFTCSMCGGDYEPIPDMVVDSYDKDGNLNAVFICLDCQEIIRQETTDYDSD